jgi:hypothetical protein
MTIPAQALAFTYRMPAGFPGTITRTYATKVEPGVIDTASPPLFFGQGVTFDSTALAIRPPLTTDSGIIGVTVRSFPTQGNFPASPAVDPIGTANCPLQGEVDLMVSGYMAVTLSGTTSVNRYSPAFVWMGATSGSHVNGGFEGSANFTYVTAPNAGNTGNGTFTVAPVLGSGNPANIFGGLYSVIFTAATKFNVYDPNGVQLVSGTTGVPYVDAKIAFTITSGGTAFVPGDGFTITATANTFILGGKSYWMGPADPNGISELAFNI